MTLVHTSHLDFEIGTNGVQVEQGAKLGVQVESKSNMARLDVPSLMAAYSRELCGCIGAHWRPVFTIPIIRFHVWRCTLYHGYFIGIFILHLLSNLVLFGFPNLSLEKCTKMLHRIACSS